MILVLAYCAVLLSFASGLVGADDESAAQSVGA
jgi:hypothetical protein